VGDFDMVNVKLDEFATYRSSYDYTAYLSNRDWAFEYLRRNSKFQAVAWEAFGQAPKSKLACHDIKLIRLKTEQPAAEEWGLKFFPNPDIAAPKATVFWTPEADPEIVHVTVLPREPGEPHDLFDETIKKCKMVHLTDDKGIEHLVHVGPGRSVQVRCSGHTLVTTKPVKTSFSVDAVRGLDSHLEIVKRATEVYGDHVKTPPVFSQKARLLRNGLIALDGSRAGLTDRQIASIIVGDKSVEEGMANGDRSLIQRVRYYRERAHELCEGANGAPPRPIDFMCDTR
tara:strand:+ start:489 stop:1343 length:855 start_codon:yes stop_codon:yes gene_type:complete